MEELASLEYSPLENNFEGGGAILNMYFTVKKTFMFMKIN
jgi:hypothetical protein